jgi:hypothetical protein
MNLHCLRPHRVSRPEASRLMSEWVENGHGFISARRGDGAVNWLRPMFKAALVPLFTLAIVSI